MGTCRVGIVTINDDTNYGNRLQNYALQEAVRSLGWEPETIRNRPPAWDRALLAPRLLHDIRKDVVGFTRRASTRARERVQGSAVSAPAYLERRRTAIREFARTRIASSAQVYSEMPADHWADRYDAAIVGSDQVWNPTYRRAQGIDFLDFVGESRRIAYAASFGIEHVPGFLRSRYRTWLNGIPQLSVRESSGRRIVADLTGRDVPVVVDPTLLVDRSAWDRLIAAEPQILPVPYAVRFFLGQPTPEQDAWVTRHALDTGLEVVDLHALDQERFADVGPAGFVAAIARAEVVYTDSFHAGIFSLLYRRSVVLRHRFDRDPRWQELLSQNGLSTRATEVGGLQSIAGVDWAAVETQRDLLRSTSAAFLRGALESSAVHAG
ncbi:polysaccharide pyruvyl transferase family protein [Agromyces humatus]|uniref:Polysaccharide pyruvyl transferase family protein n=1 Tax=Agromyces humatus TaxID=279573 RepID=A0ABP4WWU8_9MICO|nr:polysaccharide pyruvyl transferase family protein [Agromyces humatus]